MNDARGPLTQDPNKAPQLAQVAGVPGLGVKRQSGLNNSGRLKHGPERPARAQTNDLDFELARVEGAGDIDGSFLRARQVQLI